VIAVPPDAPKGTESRILLRESREHLQDVLRRDDNVEQLEQKIILPATFTGDPKYMHPRTQVAFCYVRKFGRPELFVIVTTNAKWTEITSVIGERQTAQDRMTWYLEFLILNSTVSWNSKTS
jgi:hypothetical protein